MPIIGLTDRQSSFKEIGRLRLGIPKKDALISGPKEIGYFRPDFRPDAMDAAKLFTDIYGATPDRIDIRLPFAEISRCWDAFYMAYNKTGLLGMSDGVKWLYLRHNQTGELLVKDGAPANSDSLPIDVNGFPYMPFDKTIPVYSYQNKKGQDVAVYAKPEGLLKVLIPGLKRAAFVTVITHSIYNIIHLTEQLAGVAEIAKNIGMTLPLVPMILTRRKETISVSINGKKAMQEHYLLNIEIDPAWMEAHYKYLDGVLPGALQTGKAIAALPAYIPTVQEVTEDEDGEEIQTGSDRDMDDEELDQHMRAEHGEESQAKRDITADLAHLSGVCNSEGVAYILFSEQVLRQLSDDLSKALAKNGLTDEQKAEYQRKQSAIGEILEWHKSNSAG